MSAEVAAPVRLTPVRLTIDVWSDVMCPWCLIGWHQLQKGLALVAGEIEAEVRWRPFELNPDMPPEGEPQQAHVMRKYQRTQEQAAAGRGQMQRIASDAGAVLSYTGTDGDDAPPAMMWNTFLAHKLLCHALEVGGPHVQTPLKLALFRAHFNERRNVSDPAVLLAIAEEVGLDRGPCEAALADPAMANNRYYAWHSIGALGVIELTASGRSAMVARGLRRLGLSDKERRYFDLHAVLDVKHSEDWNREVLRPLVAEDPRRAGAMAEGALMRLVCGERCFDRYRAHLWGSKTVLNSVG